MRATLSILMHGAVLVTTLFLAAALHYWLAWPAWVQDYGPALLTLCVAGLWLLPVGPKLARRGTVAVVLCLLLALYFTKAPSDRDWIPLHAQNALIDVSGTVFTVTNFRDATYPPEQAREPRWETRQFDLDDLVGADIILQPFGEMRALKHTMLSFQFASGERVAVSIEARRAVGGGYDPLAGFFRHDEIFPVVGSERDVLWQRLSRVPPSALEIYPVERSIEEIRVYLVRLLDYIDGMADTPRFYNTLWESCMTSLIRQAPEAFAKVSLVDPRRWLPGYSVSLFQDLGLIDASIPAAALSARQTVLEGVRPPGEFGSAAAWSTHLREVLSARGAITTPLSRR